MKQLRQLHEAVLHNSFLGIIRWGQLPLGVESLVVDIERKSFENSINWDQLDYPELTTELTSRISRQMTELEEKISNCYRDYLRATGEIAHLHAIEHQLAVFVEDLCILSRILENHGHFGKAETGYKKALFILEKTQPDSIELASTLSNLRILHEKMEPLLYTWTENDHTAPRRFLEHQVDGSQGDCGFTAIGTSREEAIQQLIDNATDSDTQRLIAPDILALITQPLNEGPWHETAIAKRPELLQQLRERFHVRRSTLVNDTESTRSRINNQMRLIGDAQLTLEQTLEHLIQHEPALGKTFERDLRELRVIDQEIEQFRPTPAQLEDKLTVQLQHYNNTGELLPTLQNALGLGTTHINPSMTGK